MKAITYCNILHIRLIFLGHTSVQMCERIMGNLDVLGSVRRGYSEPFHFHQTTKHKVQSSLPDVVKECGFALLTTFQSFYWQSGYGVSIRK